MTEEAQPDASEREPESALDVIWKMGRDTLAQRDFMAGRGWVMEPMPFEAEVRAMLAADPGVRFAPAACGCSCRCHTDESKPDWPGPCAACCEPGMNCDHGRALAPLAPAAAVDVEALHEDANGLVWTTKAELRSWLAALPPGPVREGYWHFDERCEVTPEDHEQGPACAPLERHSHRPGNTIKWARWVDLHHVLATPQSEPR